MITAIKASANGTMPSAPPTFEVRKAIGEECRQAAHRYLERGLCPIPLCPPNHVGVSKKHGKQCGAPGKTPVVLWKQFHRLNDPEKQTAEEIDRAWRSNCQSNVGIVLGVTHVRVDVDGDAGEQFLHDASDGDLPATWEFNRPGANSVSRGLIYRVPDGVTVRTTSAQGDGEHQELRFQGRGAQTVVPPSLHEDGNRYEWLPGHLPDDIDCAEMPGWLIAKMQVKPGEQKTFGTPGEWNGAISSADDCFANCAFLRHCDEDAATLSEPEWFGMISNVARTDGGPELVHQLSAPYPGYTPEETDAKIKHALEDTGPHTCDWIASQTGGRFCDGCLAGEVVKSPVAAGLPVPDPTGNRRFAITNNRTVVDVDGGKKTMPIPMGNIKQRIVDATDGWPRRVGSALFIHESSDIAWLEKTPAMFGYLGTASGKPPHFARGPGFHSAAEVFEEFRRTATAYTAVEIFPHHPMMPGVYYACPTPKPGDGSKLRELVARYNPATDIDEDLILSLFVTPGWGGAGDRPSFGLTSPDGRGSGKTTLAQQVGRVWGGRVEISPDESVEVVKQRLLSPDGITKRVAVIDNLKSMRFSSAGLEALVTADVISGKRMYVGEASRPNNLCWITTLNGVSFATDWAQRSIIINLMRPKYSGNWKDETEAFIDANREAIIADCIGFLQQPADYELAEFTRWGNWERDVLSRLPDPGEAQRVITERQAEADAEGEETSAFEDAVREKLREATYSPSADRVFLPSKLVAEWLNEITGERYGTTKASRYVRQRIREGGLRCIQELERNDLGRGFVWSGTKADADENIQTDLEDRIQRLERLAKDSWRR